MTIQEIADIAGVSKATVSLVFNHKGGVSEETRNKILEIAQQYGYVPKVRNELHKRTGNIRFIKYKQEGILAERNGDFIANVIDGVESAARKEGMSVKITSICSNNLEKMIDEINQDKDDGIIFLGTEFLSCQGNILHRFEAPLVVVDNVMTYCDVNSVVMNNQGAVYAAIEYLKKLGHREIGHIESSFRTDNFTNRKLGFDISLKILGIQNQPEYHYQALPDIRLSYEKLLESFQQSKNFPTAFFADNDILAIGAMKALKTLGIRVPEDISVMGMDNLILGTVSEPQLTTIKIHKKKMGELAVERLIQLIRQERTEIAKTLIGTEIIVRQSTAKQEKK